MGKIKTTPTVSGSWLELVEPITESDFVITSKVLGYTRYGSEAQADITLRIAPKLAEQIRLVVEGSRVAVADMLSSMNLSTSVLEKNEIEKWNTWIRIRVRVELRGVRSEATKNRRISDAVQEVEARSKLDSEYARELILEKIKRINDGLQAYIANHNAEVLREYERSLQENKSFFDYADKHGDLQSEKDAIAELDSRIEELRKQRDAAREMLREKRAEAWLRAWERDDWTLTHEGQSTRFPEALIEKTREAVSDGTAFRVKREIRFGF